MARFGTAAEALAVLPEMSLRGGRLRALSACSKEAAEKEMAAVEKFGARMILYGASDYPPLLHTITDPPPILTMLGHTHLWRKGVVAMVGARNASAAGCQFAQKLARELGEAGLVIASGLARGIDTFAHKGSLASGTVAVIAGGIDNIYPPENEALYGQIRESGAIASEQPFGAIPFSGAFPGRNRIIAGMALGTVVVEASPKSGSLITAKFALENNREVFAVPGSPLDPRSRGGNHLIKQGATMVESTADILQGIAHLRGRKLEENPAMTYASDHMAAALSDSELDTARRTILEKLGATAVSVDELVDQCALPAGAVMAILLELELAGRLKRSAGNKVYLMNVETAEEMA
ncbi:MAG: DNA-processing protein DprA [Pseudomonadota bacterium]|nr:DNA-processing protein DprA [Pseudomonadota bacterium]